MDIQALNKEGLRWYLGGDFNAWLGNSQEGGITGNDSRIGLNGHYLKNWMKFNGITLLNVDSRITTGLWTRQDSRSMSVLDLWMTSNSNAHSQKINNR